MNEDEFEFDYGYFNGKNFSNEEIDEFKKDPVFWRRKTYPDGSSQNLTRSEIKETFLNFINSQKLDT